MKRDFSYRLLLIFIASVFLISPTDGCVAKTRQKGVHIENSVNSTKQKENEPKIKNLKRKIPTTHKKFAEKLGVSVKRLNELLTCKEGDNTYQLIPIQNTAKHLEFWYDLFVRAGGNYMRHYASGKLWGYAYAKQRLATCYFRMRNLETMTFIMTLNGKWAGEIAVGPLRSTLAEVGYVTLEKFSGKGVTSHGARMLIRFLRYLKKQGLYRNLSAIRATAHVNNGASQRVLEKCGFAWQRKTKAYGTCVYEYKLYV